MCKVIGKKMQHSIQDADMRYVACHEGGKVCDLGGRDSDTLVERSSKEGLEVLRHTAAHVMAQAVKRLYPDAQVTIGPVIEDGFYYDFLPEKPFQEADLSRIEAEMQKIVQENFSIHRSEWSEEEAVAYFLERCEPFKAQIVRDLPKDGPISVYSQGEFIDLCRGPHCPSTGYLKEGFKLLRVSGSYWRGDSKGQPLQRIYGTAWASKEDLEAYLYRIAEAEKRDHRKVAKAMDLFHVQEEAPGCVFWHPYGWTLYRTLQTYIRDRLESSYKEVNTPQLVSQSLWQASGHWDQYQENMFALEHNDVQFALKPMNCPCHVQIFNQGIKSYKDLPLRLAEFGSCHRNEPSGALSGLMRVRNFVQDDAHIFCTPEHIASETQQFCALLQSVYQDLGFTDFLIRFATRPEKRLGADNVWDIAERSLKEGAEQANLVCELHPGEGAFYGPKLEFVLKDSLGRLWQCGTLQVDFVLPERLGANYVDAQGVQRPVVMLHRAILGSFERFMGVLLEHYAGRLPLWLAPVQSVVCSISEKAQEYAQEVCAQLQAEGIRAECDIQNEKIGHKIRSHALRKVGCIAVVGVKEAASGCVNLRIGEKEHLVSVTEAVSMLKQAIDQKIILQ